MDEPPARILRQGSGRGGEKRARSSTARSPSELIASPSSPKSPAGGQHDLPVSVKNADTLTMFFDAAVQHGLSNAGGGSFDATNFDLFTRNAFAANLKGWDRDRGNGDLPMDEKEAIERFVGKWVEDALEKNWKFIKSTGRDNHPLLNKTVSIEIFTDLGRRLNLIGAERWQLTNNTVIQEHVEKAWSIFSKAQSLDMASKADVGDSLPSCPATATVWEKSQTSGSSGKSGRESTARKVSAKIPRMKRMSSKATKTGAVKKIAPEECKPFSDELADSHLSPSSRDATLEDADILPAQGSASQDLRRRLSKLMQTVPSEGARIVQQDLVEQKRPEEDMVEQKWPEEETCRERPMARAKQEDLEAASSQEPTFDAMVEVESDEDDFAAALSTAVSAAGSIDGGAVDERTPSEAGANEEDDLDDFDDDLLMLKLAKLGADGDVEAFPSVERAAKPSCVAEKMELDDEAELEPPSELEPPAEPEPPKSLPSERNKAEPEPSKSLPSAPLSQRKEELLQKLMQLRVPTGVRGCSSGLTSCWGGDRDTRLFRFKCHQGGQAFCWACIKRTSRLNPDMELDKKLVLQIVQDVEPIRSPTEVVLGEIESF